MFQVTESDVDILCISETWLSSCTPNAYVNIPNYNIYRCDNGGSGVSVYVKDHLIYEILKTNTVQQSGVEDIWIKIQCRKFPSIIIGCIYRQSNELNKIFNTDNIN